MGDIVQMVGIAQLVPEFDKETSLGWDIVSAVAEVDIHTGLMLAVAAVSMVEIVLVAKLVLAADNKPVAVAKSLEVNTMPVAAAELATVEP